MLQRGLPAEIFVRETKNNLSKYLKLAQAGEEVVITDRGRPVARLSAQQPEGQTIDAAVARLRASPLVRPGNGGKPKGTRRPIAWKPGEKTLCNFLLEDRG